MATIMLLIPEKLYFSPDGFRLEGNYRNPGDNTLHKASCAHAANARPIGEGEEKAANYLHQHYSQREDDWLGWPCRSCLKSFYSDPADAPYRRVEVHPDDIQGYIGWIGDEEEKNQGGACQVEKNAACQTGKIGCLNIIACPCIERFIQPKNPQYKYPCFSLKDKLCKNVAEVRLTFREWQPFHFFQKAKGLA